MGVTTPSLTTIGMSFSSSLYCTVPNDIFLLNFQRYLPSKERSKLHELSESNRSAISQEVIVFISSTASKIQELNRMLDEKMSESEEMTMHLQHYRLIITSLLNVGDGVDAAV